MRSLVLILVLFALAIPTGVSAQAAGTPAGGSTDPAITALRIAFGLPRLVATTAYFSRAMVVNGLYQATILSGAGLMGQIRSTGTLAQGFGGAFQYSPEPADRLVVHWAGAVHEFVVHDVVGNPQAATADAWLLSPHQLRYSHRLEGQAEADISVAFDGAAFEVSVQGWTTQWGERYTLDLRSVGRSGGVRDYGGQDVQMAYDLTGTISGGGVAVEVQEEHTSFLVAATSLRTLPSQRGSASDSNATLTSTAVVDGVGYQFADVQVRTGTSTRGGQSSGGMTGLSGAVLRAGQPFGAFVLQAGRAFLQTEDGLVSMDGM